ncbi:MAG: efflux RND transporter permease subunit [Ignavibacteria bacterium]|nr:efflux RND transporter permease subunit [Ignavibacteria bacterium]NCS80434.1 efflux RND transporter permease subunit [Ignavibacteria bacterium]OIO15847.1 MAG: acriflavin resistance protein [Ignavibacteria bacterium CG1_02_37_35]PJC58837.1 MAG: acriflavin resistance protein [Ignavibacteria bacterium CG_4_9_14_0_2_um_filter_37_13]
MQIAKLSIERPIMTTMAILVFIIFGGIAYFSLNLNNMPDIEIPYITIFTTYPGAGPKEIETLITKRIEEVVSTVSELERVESYSLDGVSISILEFKIGKNVNIANQEVKDKVDEIINDLPDDAQKPVVQKVDFRAFPIMNLVLSGKNDPRELYEIADKTLKDRFSQIQGVAKVDIKGGRQREIRVILDDRVINEQLISLPQLMMILKSHNMNIPGGYFQVRDQEFTVRMQGEFNDIEEMKKLQIPTAFGNRKLGQLARVEDSGKDVRQRSIYFDAQKNYRNENVVKLGIIKSPEGNVVKVADAVRSILPEIQNALPKGMRLEIVNDDSDFTRASVNDAMGNIILGVIFTSIVLFLFLTQLRSTFIVALSMPISIISTFVLVKAFGLSLNMMSLMGLSVSIGVLVANSVVVIENIFRHKAMGKSNKEASLDGTKEVMVAVLASTLTNLVVFLPIANMSSMVGKFLVELALTATFATIFSLVFSFTLTPMLASLMLPKVNKPNKFSDKLNAVYDSWDAKYKRLLVIILKNKKRSWITVGSSVLIFIIATMFYAPRIGFEFLPQFDDGKIKIEVELPEGYNLNETAGVLNSIEDRVKKHPEVKYLLTNLGYISDLNTGTNMARMDVQLIDVKARDSKIKSMIDLFVRELADIPNARIVVDYGSSSGMEGAPVQFYLQGQDLSKLEELKEKVVEKVKSTPGLINFDNSSRAGKPEITVYPKREVLAEAGISAQEVALTLRSSIEGMESSKYRELGNEYDITITLNDESVNTPQKIGNIPIVSQRGVVYKLSQLAEIKFTQGYSKILHANKYTAILFSGSPAANVPLGNVTNEIDKRLKEMSFPEGYKFAWGGNTRMMNEMVLDMLFAFVLAVLLTYMLLAAMLESFVQPIYILITLPLAMIGVFASLYHTNVSFGITSLMAIVMLVGIVVNNAVLMLDYANQLVRESNMSIKDALIEACPTKLRPIIMSSLALILGMLPMALGIGDAGKEMRTPMGIVSIGGLIVSTVLTLVVIPAIFYGFSKRKKIIAE